MSIYKFRYFFDAGSGVCLWSSNARARERWSYAVNCSELPLSRELQRALDGVIASFDKGIDWAYPAESPIWNADEHASFNVNAQRVLLTLQKELGCEYEVVDESRTTSPGL